MHRAKSEHQKSESFLWKKFWNPIYDKFEHFGIPPISKKKEDFMHREKSWLSKKKSLTIEKIKRGKKWQKNKVHFFENWT